MLLLLPLLASYRLHGSYIHCRNQTQAVSKLKSVRRCVCDGGEMRGGVITFALTQGASLFTFESVLQEASHQAPRLLSYLHSILATCCIKSHTTASFPRQLCVCVREREGVLTVNSYLKYILTRFKSTTLSSIIIAHRVKGSLIVPAPEAGGCRSCPLAPSKHTSGAAWYPNSFRTHPQPFCSKA